SPFVLLMINSAAFHFDRRLGIRQTWGNAKEFNERFNSKHIWKVIFIVGRTGNAATDARVKQEAMIYGDLLVMGKKEHHKSLTEKTLLGMFWANQICPAKFYYKGDDDVWVNKWRLLDYLFKISATSSFDPANCWIGLVSAGSSAPVRHKGSKYYVSYRDFAGTRFPRFCSGFSYVMARETASKLIQSIPFHHKITSIDDVYIGLLASSSKVLPVHNPRF
ncbi:uncharacterized protein TRIADDRAFT_4948, partial [Trichoplax adhaerens]